MNCPPFMLREVVNSLTENMAVHEEVTVQQKMSTFDFNDSSKSDLELIVENRRFKVSKLVLSLASPVFDKMFHSEFKESESSELELPGKHADEVLEFLRCIYPNTLTQISLKNALQVLPLIEEYQVMQLKPKCESVLIDSINKDTSITDLFSLLNVSRNYDLNDLRSKCVKIVSSRTKSDIDEARQEIEPSPDDLVEILDNICSSLDLSVSQLQVHVESYERKLKDQETLKLCLLGQLKFTETVNIDRSLKWKEEIIFLNCGVADSCNLSNDIVLWGVPLKLLMEVVQRSQYHDVNKSWKDVKVIDLTLSCNEKNKLVYFVKVFCIAVNKKCKQENFCVAFNSRFYSDNRRMKKEIAKLIDLIDEEKGFVEDDTVSFVILLYMSEPW